jgi:hypothetical protein
MRSLFFQLIREKGRCQDRHTQSLHKINLPTSEAEEGEYQQYQFFMPKKSTVMGNGSHARGCLTKLDCEQDVSTGFI